MFKDPIVEDVRKVREEQAARYNFDIFAILAAARKRQQAANRQVITLDHEKAASPQADIGASTKEML
jgi:hypothetical protein